MKNLKLYWPLKNERSCLIINFVLLTSLLFGQRVYSQQVSDTSGKLNRRNFKEELFVRTDRDIYISGEQVWFKIYEISGLTRAPFNVSKVVYLELLDKNNFPLKQLKVQTENGCGSSNLILPDNISSGNYLIRAYTSWMQNFPADQFFYTTISVVNPYESIDHLKIPANVIKADSAGPVSAKMELSSSMNFQSDSKNQITYKVSFEKPQYSPRGDVKLKISATDKNGKPVESELSISVSRSVLVKPSPVASFSKQYENENSIDRIAGKEYLAELEGHLISGHIRQKTSDEPLKYTDLSLSFVGKTARCRFTKSDSNGEFYFLVKDKGLNEIVIQPLSPDITGYYIELSQPFSNSFSKIKAADFYIDSSGIDEINKAIIGAQISNIYDPFVEKPAEANSVYHDFFGKPENSVKMSDFIELTSLREVVKEIIPNVYTLKQNGKYDFKLINKFRGQPFENRPLVLVDGVPVYDFEKVLSINSKEIERADIINTRYFFSDNVFDGIISFITKKGNLSAMEFDNTIFRQVYEGGQSVNNFRAPDYRSGSSGDSHIPDFRNTMFWKPDAHTGKDGITNVEFFTSDESAEYTIVVEGIASDGMTGYSSVSFKVK